MLAVLAPLWLGLAILAGAFALGFLAARVVRPREDARRLLQWVALAILVLFAVEAVLLASLGAVALDGLLGPVFLPLHAVLAWCAAPALGSLALVRSGAMARWWPLVGLVAGLITIGLYPYRVGVRDIVEVAEGRARAPLSATMADGPSALLFAPSFSSNLLSVFDLRTNGLVKTIPLGSRGACCVYPLPGGGKVYVVSGLAPHMGVLDMDRLEIVKRIELADVMAEAGSPIQGDGRMFWVGEIGEAYVEGIDTATDGIVHSYPGGGGAMHVSPDGRYLFSLMADGDGHRFTVRESPTGREVGGIALPIPAGEVPSTILVDPQGAKAYVTLFSAQGGVLVLDVRDPLAPRHITRLRTGAVTLVGAFSPDGGELWLPNAGAGTVSILDVATDQVVHTIALGRYVSAVAFAGDQAYIAQSPSVREPTYLRAAIQAALGVVPGGLLAPPEGVGHWRPGLETPGEIITLDRRTRQRLPVAPMAIPSTPFTLGVVER